MYDIFIIDHGYPENLERIKKQLPIAQVVRAQDYYPLICRLADKVTTHKFWVISSCVDYTGFDFDYEPPPWEAYQIHCWPSDDQQYGDTFLIPLQNWKQQRFNICKLDDYEHINYQHKPLRRMPVPEVIYASDDLPHIIKCTEFNTPYVLFRKEGSEKPQIKAQKLWENQLVLSMRKDNSTNLVPRQISSKLDKQIYDYSHLNRQFQGSSQLQDIVFISNGEPEADANWQRLLDIAPKEGRNIYRVNGIDGRNKAYHAAAEMSQTDWFFAVFAKLEIDPNFDFGWLPYYWQEPKHYIFKAKNPVNDLVYGHQALIAYNKRLVLETQDVQDLDFTLEASHTVVPIYSGIARYNTDAWTAWRTAFREVVKLKHFMNHKMYTLETKARLQAWFTTNGAPFGDYSVKGAQDAEAFYTEVNGDLTELKKSYEWKWLRTKFDAL